MVLSGRARVVDSFNSEGDGLSRAIVPQSEAFRIPRRDADVVQQLIGLLRIVLQMGVGQFGIILRRPFDGAVLPRRGQAVVHQVIDLLTVHGVGHRQAEAPILEQPGQTRVLRRVVGSEASVE